MISELPHYYVGERLFVLYDEACDYCLINGIPVASIEKSYMYR